MWVGPTQVLGCRRGWGLMGVVWLWGGKWFIHDPKYHKEYQLLRLKKHSCWLFSICLKIYIPAALLQPYSHIHFQTVCTARINIYNPHVTNILPTQHHLIYVPAPTLPQWTKLFIVMRTGLVKINSLYFALIYLPSFIYKYDSLDSFTHGTYLHYKNTLHTIVSHMAHIYIPSIPTCISTRCTLQCLRVS